MYKLITKHLGAIPFKFYYQSWVSIPLSLTAGRFSWNHANKALVPEQTANCISLATRSTIYIIFGTMDDRRSNFLSEHSSVHGGPEAIAFLIQQMVYKHGDTWLLLFKYMYTRVIFIKKGYASCGCFRFSKRFWAKDLGKLRPVDVFTMTH